MKHDHDKDLFADLVLKHIINHFEAIVFAASVVAGCSLVFCIVFFWSVL